jgi:acyl carrier protein
MGLDTVEIVIGWEKTFGISIPDADAMVIETSAMPINHLCSRLDLGPDD